MSLKLYMDVHVPEAITAELCRRGVDILTARDDGHAEADDVVLLERASSLKRILFTRDSDFLQIAADWQRVGRPFNGLVYAHQLRATIGRCVRDLELIAKIGEPDDLANRIEHLPL